MTRYPTRHSEKPEETDDLEKPLIMQRGVSQLLFNYLPQRTVDWEDGLAIISLGAVRLSTAWEEERKTTLLREVADLFERWRSRGGTIDKEFPDPLREPERFTIGLPESISASILQTALICQSCGQLMFDERKADKASPPVCTNCSKARVRQIPFVFVHGCGELVPITEWLPATKTVDSGRLEPTKHPIRCSSCGPGSGLYMPGRSDRVKDMKVLCRKCNTQVIERFSARCHRCLNSINRDNKEAGHDTVGGEIVSRLAMRVARYSQSETYYPQTISILRLDRPKLTTNVDEVSTLLRAMLPAEGDLGKPASAGDTISVLTDRLQAAEKRGDREEADRWKAKIIEAATGTIRRKEPVGRSILETSAPDVVKNIQESIAFRETVTARPAIELATEQGRYHE